MKQKDAIKLSVAIALLAAAGIIVYLTMREPPEPKPTVPAAQGDVAPAAGTKSAGTTPGTPDIQGGGPGNQPMRGPIRTVQPK